MSDKDIILTLPEVSKYLKVSEHQMYKIARRDDFPRMNISTWGIRVRLSDLDKWLEDQKKVPNTKKKLTTK